MRFRCLLRHRTLNYDPVKAAKIIYSCAILHNMANFYKSNLPEDEVAEAGQEENENAVVLGNNLKIRVLQIKEEYLHTNIFV